MKTLLLIASVLAVSLAIMIPHDGPLVASVPPKFKLDLNVDPEHRWDNIIPTYKPIIKRFVTYVLNLLPLSKDFYNKVGEFGENTPYYAEYIGELKGIGRIAGVEW